MHPGRYLALNQLAKLGSAFSRPTPVELIEMDVLEEAPSIASHLQVFSEYFLHSPAWEWLTSGRMQNSQNIAEYFAMPI